MNGLVTWAELLGVKGIDRETALRVCLWAFCAAVTIVPLVRTRNLRAWSLANWMRGVVFACSLSIHPGRPRLQRRDRFLSPATEAPMPEDTVGESYPTRSSDSHRDCGRLGLMDLYHMSFWGSGGCGNLRPALLFSVPSVGCYASG